MAASANMFYIAIDYKNKASVKGAANNIDIKTHQLFSKQLIRDYCTEENLWGFDIKLAFEEQLDPICENNHNFNLYLFK